MPETTVPTGHITNLLLAWSEGDRTALEELMPLVYQQLSRIAHRQLRRERSGHTLETSALVHEAFMRLIEQDRVRWRDRAQFFAISSQLMRRILVDHARQRLSLKRGGDAVRLTLDDVEPAGDARPPDLLALDDALSALSRSEPQAARLVEMRYFGGLTKAELAEVLGCSTATIDRRWRVVRAWLYSYLVKGECHEL
jgi:RNA polymerase sigma factor (TIGR02999 family)